MICWNCHQFQIIKASKDEPYLFGKSVWSKAMSKSSFFVLNNHSRVLIETLFFYSEQIFDTINDLRYCIIQKYELDKDHWRLYYYSHLTDAQKIVDSNICERTQLQNWGLSKSNQSVAWAEDKARESLKVFRG